MYGHGIEIVEKPTRVPDPVRTESGYTVVFGTAPVNLAADPAKAVNNLFLCHTLEEAKAAVGYSDEYKQYSLCQAMDAFFVANAIGPMILCNVLDPAKHKLDYSEELQVIGDQVTSTEKGIMLDTLTVTGSELLTRDTDYVAEFTSEGYVLVTLLKSGVMSLTLAGERIDASKVVAADVIGAYDAATGKETGFELIRQVYPKFGLAPGFITAPGWSQKKEVALAMAAKCKKINGAFRCECIVDIDTKTVLKYTDVAEEKTKNGYDMFENMICVWPMVKYAGKLMRFSAMYAAVACKTDYNNGNVPNIGISNIPLGISATVLEDGTEVLLDQIQGNALNAVGVVTAINLQGYKTWGNNTACYPANKDPKDRWINCRRFFSWHGNGFITRHFSKLDSNTDRRLIESYVDSENIFGNSLVARGKCAGCVIEYLESENPIGNIMDGKMKFRQKLAPYPVSEHIINELEFDVSMIQNAIGGE